MSTFHKPLPVAFPNLLRLSGHDLQVALLQGVDRRRHYEWLKDPD